MSGQTTGGVRWILRVEGLCVVTAAALVYSKLGFSWGTFALYFLVPDLSLLGYLAGPRIGAISYNLAHAYIGALACLTLGYLSNNAEITCAGLIWCAHLGFDRALGYGLKYSAGFQVTHLGLIGRHAK